MILCISRRETLLGFLLFIVKIMFCLGLFLVKGVAPFTKWACSGFDCQKK